MKINFLVRMPLAVALLVTLTFFACNESSDLTVRPSMEMDERDNISSEHVEISSLYTVLENRMVFADRDAFDLFLEKVDDTFESPLPEDFRLTYDNGILLNSVVAPSFLNRENEVVVGDFLFKINPVEQHVTVQSVSSGGNWKFGFDEDAWEVLDPEEDTERMRKCKNKPKADTEVDLEFFCERCHSNKCWDNCDNDTPPGGHNFEVKLLHSYQKYVFFDELVSRFRVRNTCSPLGIDNYEVYYDIWFDARFKQKKRCRKYVKQNGWNMGTNWYDGYDGRKAFKHHSGTRKLAGYRVDTKLRIDECENRNNACRRACVDDIREMIAPRIESGAWN